MSLGTLVQTNIVLPITKEILKPENLARIADAIGTELKDFVGADNDRVILLIRQDLSAVSGDIVKSVDTVGDNLAGNINSVVDNLFKKFTEFTGGFPIPGIFKGGGGQ